MEGIIKKTQEFVKKTIFSKAVNEEEKRYRYEHTLRVATIGKYIAEQENLCVEAVVLGCLLHDIGKFDAKHDSDHGRVSARMARPFLESILDDTDLIQQIIIGIAIHVDGKGNGPFEASLEAETISDSDNIDRYDAYHVIDNLTNDQLLMMSNEDACLYLHQMIDRLSHLKTIHLATPCSTDLFHHNVIAQLEYYEKLYAQYEKTYAIFDKV